MTQNKFSFLYNKKNKYVTIGEIREAAIKKIRKETFLWAESGAEDGLTLNKNIQELDIVTIRFAGDSGDGMQLTGNQFSDNTALFGNDLSTLPDFPAEIRAPAGSLAGVSSFQLQ